MDSIDKMLANAKIEALNEFHDEPVPPVSSAQGVREFLSTVAGPGWMHAGVVSYPIPGGVQVHIASLTGRFMRGIAQVVVVEALDGSLSLPSPVAEGSRDTNPLQILASSQEDGTAEQVQAYNSLLACVKKISQALRATGKIVNASEAISAKRKAQLLRQLVHADQHLVEYLHSIRPQE